MTKTGIDQMRAVKSILNICLLGGLCLGNGCEVVGTVLHVFTGEPPIAAQYSPRPLPTLVLVENYRSPDEMQLDGDQIAHEVTEELKKEAKMNLIDPDTLVPAREDDPVKYRSMTIPAVARSVGAQQVIYVDLLESAVKQDPSAGAIHAMATARVRVVDVASGETLWPATSSHGREIAVERDFDEADAGRAAAMHTDMLVQLSSEISKLFYRWKPDNQTQENSGG